MNPYESINAKHMRLIIEAARRLHHDIPAEEADKLESIVRKIRDPRYATDLAVSADTLTIHA